MMVYPLFWCPTVFHGWSAAVVRSGLHYMARDKVFAAHVAEFRVHLFADIYCQRAARVEAAAARRVHRAGYIAHQDDALAFLFDDRIGDRHGGEQRLGVGVQGIVVERIAIRQFDDFAQIHDGDTVGDVADHRQIVRDKQVG